MIIEQSSLNNIARLSTGEFNYIRRLNETRNIRKEYSKVTVFLSHSHADKKYIEDIRILLN